MTEEEKNLLQEYIGGQGDDYAKVIAERLEEAGVLNTRNNPYTSGAVRKVWQLEWSNTSIELEFFQLYYERKEEAKQIEKKKSKLLGRQKKSEAATSDSK